MNAYKDQDEGCLRGRGQCFRLNWKLNQPLETLLMSWVSMPPEACDKWWWTRWGSSLST